MYALCLHLTTCRTYNFQDTKSAYPSYNCIIAHTSYSYDVYIGDDSYLQQQTAKYFQDNPGLLKVRGRLLVLHADMHATAHWQLPGLADRLTYNV